MQCLRIFSVRVALALWAWCALQASAAVEAPTADGLALYQANCAACHEGKVPRAPHMITFSMLGAEAVYRL